MHFLIYLKPHVEKTALVIVSSQPSTKKGDGYLYFLKKNDLFTKIAV